MAKSKTKQHKLTHPTVDWDHATNSLKTTADAKQYNLPYADAKPKGKQYGMRITVDAFHQLLKGAIRVHEGQKQPSVRFVEFSKASILRVLSQPGCEYVRFYFVYPEKNKMSLVLEGVDAAGQALKLATHVMKIAAAGNARAADEEDPDYEEVGHGVDAFSGSATPPVPPASAGLSKPAAMKAKAKQPSLAALLKVINAKSGE